MISLISASIAERKIAESMRQHRLALTLTQADLALHSGVNLSTLRKFEQKGRISLESFLKIVSALGILDKIVEAVKPINRPFASIDDVINAQHKHLRKRGRRK